MEHDATILGVTSAAFLSGVGYIMKRLNSCDKQQRALELHLAEHHMTKSEVKEFIELTNQPINQKIDTMTTQVSGVDVKLDRLLMRGKP